MPTNLDAYRRRKAKLNKSSKMCPCCDLTRESCDCDPDCPDCTCHRNKKAKKSFKEFYQGYEDR